jgi:phospholipid/cholesterol/gamma-HCH transport system substrate-binding protein
MSDGGKIKTRRVSVGGKPFSARNPLPIGAIGLVMIIALLWAAFNASSLPIIGSGTTYTAYFSEDANLRPDDVVLVAGVKVGSVETTGLETSTHCRKAGTSPGTVGTCVKITFKVKNAFIGNQSRLQIKLKTLLGAKYLSIDSVGSKPQSSHNAIPLSRTASLFDVYPAFTELTHKIDSINTSELSKSFTTLADTFRHTPPSVRNVLRGLSRISDTISSRDEALRTLLARANDVTGVLASRDVQLQKIFRDGGLLLDELHARRNAIHSLLVNTTTLSVQLEGLVHDNEKTIGPLLNALDRILTLLSRNQETLDRGLSLLGPFYRVFTNSIGNGRWFDNYICNFSVAGILNQGSSSQSPSGTGACS